MRFPIFILLFFLIPPLVCADYSVEALFRRLHPHSRRPKNAPDPSELRKRISEHRIRLSRLQQESRDLVHERAFLEKTLELKRGQKTMQDGQVKLSQAELEDKAKEIAMYKREAPRTLKRYNELVRTQRDMQETLNRLHRESEQLVNSKETIMRKIHTLSMGDLVERHARGLPDAMAGALRKSAAALVPFFDYLTIAADTNNRLVDHVGKEIDRYTHANITGSPFMSGVLFYCVVLIPGIAILAFMKRLVSSSSRLTATHFIILGNFYFLLLCILNVVVVLILRQDPVGMWFERHEHTFILANLFLALYYVWHIGILALQAAVTLERRNISQLLATCSVGVHYFLFTWRRVFTDTAPNMYLFNYMMYGTIFGFILYERLGRLSSRQLNENASFRFVHHVIMRHFEGRGALINFDVLKKFVNTIWTNLAMSSRSSRRFSQRYASDKRRRRPETQERQKTKHIEEDSEEEESDVSTHRSPIGRRNQGNRRGRVREPPGFINTLFGNRGTESGSSFSSDSDDPRPRDPQPWLRRTKRPDQKKGGTKPSRWALRSIWKWS